MSPSARLAATVACAALLAAGSARADDPRSRPDTTPVGASGARRTADDDEALTPVDAGALQARAALDRGLAYLAAQQRSQRDGSFPRAGGHDYVPVPLAALGALAFMAAGSAPERGPFGAQVSAAIDYLLAHADMNAGSATRGYIASEGDQLSRMHGHGYATIALAMAWTESPKSARGERVREVLSAAIGRIEASQTIEGGWFYYPTSGVQHENSVTVVLLQALRSARNVGVAVDSGCIARAVDYVGRCQNENGMFRYQLDVSSDVPTLALTAAGITTLNAAGRYDQPEVKRAMTVLWQGLEARSASMRPSQTQRFPHYERLYVALALWTSHDEAMFNRWYVPEREKLLENQREDGSWSDDDYGSCYATAMNCLVLALPQQLLPLFER